jgi:chromosome segregation ATPase
VENETLRNSLEQIPKKTGAERGLEKIIEQLNRELESIRRREADLTGQLNAMGRENAEAFQILEAVKTECDRLKNTNSSLNEKLRQISSRPVEDVRAIKDELDR